MKKQELDDDEFVGISDQAQNVMVGFSILLFLLIVLGIWKVWELIAYVI